ncbi:LamG domain-containing protein [Limobrevibacterium gyesilva]|uniref:LamG domain-containing protein n=1 Tax=Limobrevibacterium gyesilva TaxID=2991712 RepID=A0AA42CIP9_9PROT|nr:LamG domain-containing protein [Limobrevibacterium gyesilva]MCW3476147.1 LamG domain-containing protein [Limobrevibacterium gyesilva]
MNRVMGYCDRWTAAPGETVRFMVSCLGGDHYDAQIVRLLQPDAGPLATPFRPEPVAAACNGTHAGRHQAIPIGSLAAVPAHAALRPAGSFTLCAHVFPTTPAKGRQAVMGTWCEASQTGFGLEIGEDGALAFRVGAGPGRVARISAGAKLSARRWYFAAAAFDAERGMLTLWQEPLSDHDFHPEQPVVASAPAAVRPAAGGALTFAAWSTGPADGPSCWGGLGFAGHMNGRIDAPRLASGALDRAAIGVLAASPLAASLAACLMGAWDFSRDMSGDAIRDLGPWRLDGVIVNQPTRAMRGHNWNATETDWTRAPEQYGAIHFHDDDLVDACWHPDFAFTVPEDLRSGVYAARLTADGFDFWVPFFVRPPRGTAHSKVAFLASTATYTVYLNNRGRFMSLATERYQGRVMVMDAIDSLLIEFPEMGLSTYDRHSDGSGVAYSSRHRPLQNFRPTGRHWNFNLDLFIVDWLERLGGDYDVITEEDLHREGLDLLAPYQVVITGSHPEYDSVQMLDAFEAYLRRGGRLMYMGGNGFYWRIAHHPSREGVIEVRRAEGGVRAWDAEPGEAYHSFSGEYGGLWRRNARAPQRLVGVGFISQGFDKCSYFCRTQQADDPRAAWMFAGVPDTLIGDFGILQGGAAGLEIDAVDPRLGTPPHALVVACSENHSNTYELVAEEVLIPHGATDAVINPDIHADITFFETPQGGAVFSTGSIAYAGSLAWNGFDNNLFRLTTNVLNRFKDPTPFPMP